MPKPLRRILRFRRSRRGGTARFMVAVPLPVFA
jgi:hypothetical protein